MLKAMRKNVKSLSPVLWIVIAAFVITIFAVWGGASRVGESGGNNKVVQIGKEVITAEEYFQVLRQRIEAMQKDYPELNLEMIKQLNLPQQILEQMIQQRLLLSLAKEMGLKVTDQELQEKIISYPVFQRDGKFIGFEEYKRILDWNHIPIGQFEDSLRDEILLTKVLQLLTAGVAVTEEEAWESYRNQNETAKIEYLVASAEGFPVSYDPNEEELRSYFESNKSKYQIPEKREGQLVFIKTEELKKQIIVSDSEIENYYRQHINQFKEPAKIKVSRIYLTYTEPDKQQVIEQSKNLKARLDSGEDFSELARIYSQDEKAADGGDWGYYDWQAFTAEEIQVINQLEVGQVSEPVDLGYAISILKATEKMPEITKPLDEVKAMIQNNLLEQKAREQASERMEKLAKIAKKTRSLEQAAKREGLTSQETGLLTAGEPIPEIDSSGFLSQTLFELDEKELSSPIFTYEGVGLVQLTRIEPQHQASFEEVQTQVLNDFLNDIKKEKIKEKLASLIHDQAISWEKIAEENNLEYKRVETHKRGQYLSLIDNTEVLDNLVFSLPLNQPSEPFETAEGYAVVRVLERKEVNREDFARVKDQETENLLNEAREMFLYSYLQKAREDMKIKINYNLFSQVTDDLLGRIGG
ncbi:MAG: SurA N-terminal domain-containing protein [Acidobacteriota bacterium]|nr:SurA N-terminal domain-containing protein [Acidobacteriota bacterium]MDW3228964.1 SurA N-terminal domain-containing protein [Acidobacteriota bacterium]MDY0231669.1 SurA N-terminal domain-containing protein [Candidatus Saccharicenans sp.]